MKGLSRGYFLSTGDISDYGATVARAESRYPLAAGSIFDGACGFRARCFVPPEVLRALIDYSWPGNVRELRSIVERCIYLCEAETVNLADLPEEMLEQIRPRNRYCLPDDKTLEEVELEYIRYILDRCQGNRLRAAEILGINRKTIQRKLNI